MKYNESLQQQIEAYLRQEMSDLERSGFERRMHDDPELHEEVHKQEAIIEAIREERVLALKTGLRNVRISLWSSTLMEMARTAALVTGLGLASAGAYYWYAGRQEAAGPLSHKEGARTEIPQTGDSESLEKTTGQSEEVSADKLAAAEETGSEAKQHNRSGMEAATQTESHSVSVKLSATKSATDPSGSVLPEGEIQEPSVRLNQPETQSDLKMPDDGISGNTKPEAIQPEVVIKRDNKEKLHYQFLDGKLVLYADFSEKLYEVLELNQYGQRQLYLAYDGKFFALDPMVSEISPLREVKDKNLIQILSVYQKRK